LIVYFNTAALGYFLVNAEHRERIDIVLVNRA